MYRIQALFILLLIAVNTLAWCLPLFACALLRLISPASLHAWCTRRAMNLAEGWIAVNNFIFRVFDLLQVELTDHSGLSQDNWYLVISNHQAWSDIFILQAVFNRRIPMLKFFIKQILLWVPVIGIAWWVLDFPVMRRYSREQLERQPALRTRDQETTRRACERFKLTPVSVLNFLEGTRFSEAKRERFGSPYRHLLPPKAGGASVVLAALSDRLSTIVDVTIQYPDGAPTLMAFLGGRAGRIRVSIREIAVPAGIRFDTYDDNAMTREAAKAWLNEIWLEKDQQLSDGLR